MVIKLNETDEDAGLWGTAIHEAGHAVAAIENDLTFELVTIIPEKGCFGYCMMQGTCWDADTLEEQQELVRRHVCVSFAGPLAEAQYLGSEHWIDASSEDYGFSVGRVRWFFDKGERQIIQHITAQAKRFVKKKKSTIERVARALMQRKTLSYDEVVKIIRGL